MLVLFPHHKELAIDLEVLFSNPLIHTRRLKSRTAHTPGNDRMRFSLRAPEMKGLCRKGSLGLFNHSQKKAAGPPNKPEPPRLETSEAPRHRKPSHRRATAICWGQQDGVFAGSPSPGGQSLPNSAERRHFLLKHMAAPLPARTVPCTRGGFRQSRGSIGSAGRSFVGNDTDRNQESSLRGEKLFPPPSIYRSMT